MPQLRNLARKLAMILINKHIKLSSHMTSMPINDLLLIKQNSLIGFRSKEEGNDQESIHSSTTPDPEHHTGKWQKHKNTSHTRKPRGKRFPSRWSQGCKEQQGWTQRGCLRGGGGGTSSQRLEPSGMSGERIWKGRWWRLIGGGPGELPRKFFKIYVSENAFRAILKPSFAYSITSILSKVSHSNPRGGGGVLWYFHTHVGSGYFFFWGGGGDQNFEFRYFWGFSEKWYSFGYEDLWIFWGGGVITKLGYI